MYFDNWKNFEADKGDNGGTVEPAAEPSTPDSTHMIPKTRFDEVNTRAQRAEAELERIKAEQKAATEKRLAEQQEWQQLAESRGEELANAQAKAAQVEAYEQVMKANIEAELKLLSDHGKSLFPENYSTVEQWNWLQKNRSILMKPEAPPTSSSRGAGGPAGAAVELTAEEQAMARKFGMSAEEYAKYKD